MPCRPARIFPAGRPAMTTPRQAGGMVFCRMVSNEIVLPPTHYDGGPAAAADAAVWPLRGRRRGSVVCTPRLGGAGPVVLLWCGGCRLSAPPLFQRKPGRPQAAALPWFPSGRAHNQRGRLGRSTLCPLVHIDVLSEVSICFFVPL